MSVSPGPGTAAPSLEAAGTSPALPPPSLAGRLRGRLRRLQSWYRQHPTWADTILAAVIMVSNILVGHLLAQVDDMTLSFPATVTRFPLVVPVWLTCLTCLALRRRFPLGSYLVLVLTTLVYDDVLGWLYHLSPEETTNLLDPLPLIYTLGLPIALGTIAFCCRQLVTWTALVGTCGADLLDTVILAGFSLTDAVTWVSTVITTLLLLVAALVGLNLRSARARVTEAETRASRQALAREQSALLAASTERSRIAREMHDVVAHSLAVMITMADGAVATIDRDPAMAKQALTMLAEAGRTALADTRRLVGVLREDPALSQALPEGGTEAAEPAASPAPRDGEDSYTKGNTPKDQPRSSPTVRDLPVPEFAPPGTVATVEPSTQITSLLHEATSSSADSSTGATPLAPAPEQADIAALVNRFRSAGVPVSYTWSGRELPDDKGLQLTVFRITQEALTNILRYAPTSPQVTITVERHTGAVVLTVDNESAPGSRPMHGSGKGLIGMRERAAVYGGTVQAGPTATGWRVRAVLRWEETEEGTSSWQMPM